MKKSKLIILGILVLFLLSGAGIVVMSAMKTDKEPEKDESTFAVATDVEVFQTVPKMEGKSISITDARDIGDDSYMLYGENTTFEEYQDYLALLEKNGFAKQVDNGENGIDGKVYLAHYLKDDLLVTVTYFVNVEKTMITATNNTLLSPNLRYLRAGNFTAGSVGLQMCVGNTQMGSAGSFEDAYLEIGIGALHKSVYDSTHKYRVDVWSENGIMYSQPFTATTEEGRMTYLRTKADPNCKYYRVEIYDLTTNTRIALGNPIWNSAEDTTAE